MEALSIQAAPFDPSVELKAFTEACRGAGAIVSFTGLVRGDREGDGVRALTLQHYPKFTDAAVAAMIADAHRRWRLDGVRVVHRVAELRPGEAIVFVAAAARHRRDAFQAADFLMDELKLNAPIWKKERGPSGERWIEPRAQDRDDHRRWMRPDAAKG